MYTVITEDISKAVRVIREGRVVAFPTGTSYGLAVDALQGHALQRLRNLKGRATGKSFTVFLDLALWDEYFELTEAERRVLTQLAGQPLTLLVRFREILAHVAQAGSVGLRVNDHPLMAALAEAAGIPLTATSANRSGEEPCYSPAGVQAAFPGQINPQDTRYGDIAPAGPTTYDLSLGCILDGGQLPKRPATTIARLDRESVAIVREGTLGRKELEEALHTL